MEEKENKTYCIVKSNKLIEAKYKLTLNEQRLILILISLIKPEDKEFKEYLIQISELKERLGLNDNDYYGRIKQATHNLLRNPLSINEESGILQIGWISSAKYLDNEGLVKLCFDPQLKPYLLQLKEHFTSYKLDTVLRFKSIYSIRLYELLLKEYNYYRKTKDNFIFELIKFKEILGIDKKQYSQIIHLKSRILEPARKELQAKSDIYFEYECIKTGRKITAINFTIKPNLSVISQSLPTAAPILPMLTTEAIKSEAKAPASLTEEQVVLVKSLLDNGFKPRTEAENFID